MTSLTDRPLYVVLLLSAVAIILFSTAGIARMMGMSGGFLGIQASPPAAKEAVVAKSKRNYARRMCPHCGVITSMRELPVGSVVFGDNDVSAEAGSAGREPLQPGRKFEIVVLMADGSRRVFVEEHQLNWREGERLIFIDASTLSN